MTAQDTIPEDIMQAANAVIASAQSRITIDTIEQAMDGHIAIREVYVSEIAKAILAERQNRFEDLQAAYRRGVDFACEGAGVVDEDYVNLWKYVPKAAYDYADNATAPKGGEA